MDRYLIVRNEWVINIVVGYPGEMEGSEVILVTPELERVQIGFLRGDDGVFRHPFAEDGQ